jgi:hypothetical protein
MTTPVSKHMEVAAFDQLVDLPGVDVLLDVPFGFFSPGQTFNAKRHPSSSVV